MERERSGKRVRPVVAALAALALGAAADDNPAERGQAAAGRLVPPPLSPEEEARAEAAVAAREQAQGRAFDPAFREALKRAPETLDPGDAAADLVFTPIPPCRVLDTRAIGGPLPPGGQLSVRVAGALSGQGGAPNCGVPFGAASAAVLNFVAAAPQGPGNLRTWPFGGAVPTASVLNYQAVAGLNIANGVVAGLCNPGGGACAADVVIQADASATHVVVDVMGYFRRLRLPLFQAGNWLFQTVPPSGAAQLASLTFTPELNAVVRLRARGYCNMAGVAGGTDEVHVAIGANAADAFDTTANPVSNWGILLVPAGAPLVRHVQQLTAERFVSVAAGTTYTYSLFGRHQAGARTDDCSGTFFVETSF